MMSQHTFTNPAWELFDGVGINLENINEYFRWVCGVGCLTVIKWLHENFTIIRTYGFELIGYEFPLTCESGFSSTVMWICRAFALTREDVCPDPSNFASFIRVCRSDDLKLVQWFCKKFGIGRDDIIAGDYFVIDDALDHNALDTAKWLVDTFTAKS